MPLIYHINVNDTPHYASCPHITKIWSISLTQGIHQKLPENLALNKNVVRMQNISHTPSIPNSHLLKPALIDQVFRDWRERESCTVSDITVGLSFFFQL